MDVLTASGVNIDEILATQDTKTFAELGRVLANKHVVEARIAFAPAVPVEHAACRAITILGLDVTLRRDISGFWRRVLCLLDDRDAVYRYDRVLAVELLRSDGGSVGGSVFYVSCEHADVDGGNSECKLDGFANHVAAAGRADGLGVDVAYRRHGLATMMYGLATAYARSQGFLLVPSTHVQGFGKNMWRRLMSMGHTLPAEYAARVLS